MIEALKSDEIITKVGGRFKLCALIQRRLVQLMDGARPMVERHGRSDLEIVIDEIMQDKLRPEYDLTDGPTLASLSPSQAQGLAASAAGQLPADFPA
ncbi:MAG: DNA-directed RNA polymerase subunit omega [Planctomyces sp.]|nr:DNA-directed RNA polymerase subunit omega [Planctomyces sp.]MBA4039276.1 DNA-directed RNA polymerase subunit omega [Planctomyces sp.]MBA4120022.1 DNA-directed RNA polymerase subunit omega [Isosphaera sp.]